MHYMGKRKDITSKVYNECIFFRFKGTKTRKRVNSSVYDETEQY